MLSDEDVTLLFCSFLIGLSAFGQSDTTYWATKGDFSIQFNQASFSNWATGGDNSYSGVIGLDYSFDFKKDKLSWENNLILSYGLQSLAKDTRKTEDKIDFSSKYGYKLSDKAYFGALFSVKSQFTNGYNYPNKTDFISRFGAPLYVSIGPGIDYKYNEFLSLFISPASIQWVIINDDYLAAKGVFGNDPGEKIRTQFGASVKMHFNKEIAKKLFISDQTVSVHRKNIMRKLS